MAVSSLIAIDVLKFHVLIVYEIKEKTTPCNVKKTGFYEKILFSLFTPLCS